MKYNTIELDNTDYRKLAREDHEEYQEIESAEWIQDGKYQYAEFIVKHIPTGKFYCYTLGRSGSPFTDWYYDYENGDGVVLTEVEQKEVTKVELQWIGVPAHA